MSRIDLIGRMPSGSVSSNLTSSTFLYFGVVMAKKKTVAQKKISKVMREYKKGALKSGSKKGPKVTSKQQAIAIALSEAKRARAKSKRKN